MSAFRGLVGTLGTPLLLALLAGCSRHFEARVDASGASSASADATTHATETRDEAPTKTVTVTRRPDGTVRTKTTYKGAVAVRRELEADAKTLLSGETSLKTETETSSKPGGIFALWPLLLTLIPVAIGLLKPAWLGIAWGFVKSLFGRKAS